MLDVDTSAYHILVFLAQSFKSDTSPSGNCICVDNHIHFLAPSCQFPFITQIRHKNTFSWSSSFHPALVIMVPRYNSFTLPTSISESSTMIICVPRSFKTNQQNIQSSCSVITAKNASASHGRILVPSPRVATVHSIVPYELVKLLIVIATQKYSYIPRTIIPI